MLVVGGGIIGLTSALAAAERADGAVVVVVEKEPQLASHQSGRNSGVLHSGIYYAPGSLKARLCRVGNTRLQEFCRANDVAVEVTGKLIVATEPQELGRLDDLYERATAHGLAVERLGPDGLRDHEPHVAGIAGLHVPSTGVVDFVGAAEAMARLLMARGGHVVTSTAVTALRHHGDGWTVETTATGDEGSTSRIRADAIVNCAGLHSDRVTRLSGADPTIRVLPFRGEYFELTADARALVRHLVYPVPDPSLPFLGVHFTRGVDGAVHCGPNAVLAGAREGYRWRDVNARDLLDTISYRGSWRLGRRHLRVGAGEVVRSLSRRRFVRSLQRLVPDVSAADLVRAPAGVRAQAVASDGSLVDDFLLVTGPRAVHVCNAPSPAATASLEIGRLVVAAIPR